MPRRRKEHQFFSIETALIYQREITLFYLKHSGKFRGLQEYQTLINFACHSLHRNGLPVRKELLENFGRLYSRSPDATIEFLIIARGILKKWESTKTGKVIKFLCSHNLIPIEDRKIYYNSDGDPISVIFMNKLTGKTRKDSLANKSVDEVDRLSFPRLVHVGSLSDKEVAKILESEGDISSEIVKKARQELANIFHEIKFLKNPDVRDFGKTGIKTEAYQVALTEYLKREKVSDSIPFKLFA